MNDCDLRQLVPGKQSQCRTLSEARVDELLAKLRARGEVLLVVEDYADLQDLLESFAHLSEVIAQPGATLSNVRGTLGLPASLGKNSAAQRKPSDSDTGPAETENASRGEPGQAVQTSDTKPARNEHGRRKASDFANLEEAHHTHTCMHAGDECPSCFVGKIYDYRPSNFTSIAGRSPLVATRHTVDTLQCNLCKKVFKAPLPEVIENDGISGRTLYSYSAIALVGIYRFFGGLPMHRQDALQKMLGVAVPDASIWDMCEKLGDALRPIRRALTKLASSATLFYGDDTGATILEKRSAVRNDRRTGKPKLRTGCHTTCVIAIRAEDETVVLFLTGIHHTGEVMDQILEGRDESLPPPIFMGDAIASNTVTQAVVLYASCNAHAIRRFKALAERYPEYTDYVLSRYKQIYENDEACERQELTAEERCQKHKAQSRPLLREITDYGEDLLETHKVEPNSDIGEALNYVIDNERRLAAFARHPGAPLDNNRCERQLRTCVRLRETAHFFRSVVGAAVADVILSVGATAATRDINLLDYFTSVLRFSDDVREHPHRWLPWTYPDRFAFLTGVDPPESQQLKLPAFSEA